MAEFGIRRLIITVTVVMATVLELIDISIVNVAVPHMSGNLGATLEDTAWVVTAYAIANVIVIPMTSFLGRLFGRRVYYIGSIALFTACSVGCGNASGLWELVFFRFLQGLGGGALLSTSQSILFETYTPEERSFAAGIFSLGVVIGPTIGPTLGGWIVDTFSWRWIFYVNLPVGLIAMLMCYIYIPEPEYAKRQKQHIDWTGIGLLVAGIGSLQVVLERGEAEDWFQTPYITVLAVVAALSLIGFLVWELVVDDPVVDLRVLRSPTLAIAAFMTFVMGAGLFSSVFIVPVFAQHLLGFTAMQTGLLLMPGAAMAMVMLPMVGKALQHGFPLKIMVMSGFIGFGLFTWLLSKSTMASGEWDFFWPLIIRGIGISMLSVPLTTLAVSGLAPKEIPQGVAINNMMRQVGGSFGIALINTYVSHRAWINRDGLISHISNYSTATVERISALTHKFMAAGSDFAHAHLQALQAIEGIVRRQTFLLSYMDAFRMITIFFLFCVPLVLTVRSGRRKAAKREDDRKEAMAH